MNDVTIELIPFEGGRRIRVSHTPPSNVQMAAFFGGQTAAVSAAEFPDTPTGMEQAQLLRKGLLRPIVAPF
ncbi:MAG: hypothetical protein OT477_14725 [Chloroflexi bacterium]|nr:hypothetical protein [Chloroflexota bacterium]